METKQHRELLFSLSKKNGDFIVKASRSSGPGGQKVNKTSTKIQITHPASGAQGVSQTHRTQEKNRSEAFRRLVASKKFKTWLRIELARRGVQGPARQSSGPTGSRGEKVRTYNVPRDEVLDHRTEKKINNVEDVLDGNIDKIIEDLKEEEIRCRLMES